MTKFEEALERVQRNMYRIRSNVDLIGIGMIGDMVQSYKEVTPNMVPPGQEPTMATDGENVYIGPEFTLSLIDSEMRFILLHELYHVALKHHLRMGNTKLDPSLQNKAKDAVINGILKRTEAYRSGFITWPDGGFYQERFAGPEWSWEMVYKVLEAEEKQKQQEEPEDQGEDQNGEGGEDGDGGDKGEGDEDQVGEQGGPEAPGGPSDDDGEGEATQGGGESQAPQKPRGEGAWGAVWEPERELTPEEVAEAEQEIDAKIAEGEFAEKTWGVGSGKQSSLGVVRETHHRPSSWEILRNLLEPLFSYEKTWARPSNLYPDDYRPSRKHDTGVLHVCLDVSGSFSMPEIELSLANTRAICEQIGVSMIKVSYVDYDVLRPSGETWEEFNVADGDEVEFQVTGRGGTRFDPIFDSIDDEDEDVTCLVYFTDGEGFIVRDEPDFPVVWATTHCDPYTPKDKTLWGDVINIAEDLSREEIYG